MINITCDKYSEYCWIRHMIETGYSNTFIGDDFCNKFNISPKLFETIVSFILYKIYL